MASTRASFSINDLDNFFDESTLSNLHKFAKKVENVFNTKQEEEVDNWIVYDIVSINDKYTVLFDVPGVDKEKLNLSFIDDEYIGEFGNKYLKVTIERIKEDFNFIKCNRKYGTFERKIKLPNDVDVSKDMSAQYKDGVLKVSIYKKNKKDSEEGKKIPIF